jgi:hypothetical protein
MDTAKFTKEEPTHSKTKNEVKRVYHAPRLDSAFDFQEQVVKHGKTTAPIVTLLSFIGGPLGVLGVIGLIGYWVVAFQNKDELETLEKQLYLLNKENSLDHDISDMKCFWLKFGPAVSYVTSILAVVFIIARWFWNYRN